MSIRIALANFSARRVKGKDWLGHSWQKGFALSSFWKKLKRGRQKRGLPCWKYCYRDWVFPPRKLEFIRQLLNASANRSIGTGEEYGNGLLDVRHAFEIYDDFEESYVPGVFEYAGIAESTEPYVAGGEPFHPQLGVKTEITIKAL